MCAEARLKELGSTLPEVPAPVANYLPYRIAGNLLFLAGQGPRDPEGKVAHRQGRRRDVGRGGLPARPPDRTALLAAMRMALGSLDRVDRVVKMLCMVNAVPDFKDHPKVANGMSDLFVEVFGENGKHAPLGGRHGLAAEPDIGRDRGRYLDQAVDEDAVGPAAALYIGTEWAHSGS